MAAKVIRMREEAYRRVLEVSRAYGLTMAQAANLLILGSVGPRSDGKRGKEALPPLGRARAERFGLKCPQCREDLELMTSGPGLYMLKCPYCCLHRGNQRFFADYHPLGQGSATQPQRRAGEVGY